MRALCRGHIRRSGDERDFRLSRLAALSRLLLGLLEEAARQCSVAARAPRRSEQNRTWLSKPEFNGAEVAPAYFGDDTNCRAAENVSPLVRSSDGLRPPSSAMTFQAIGKSRGPETGANIYVCLGKHE